MSHAQCRHDSGTPCEGRRNARDTGLGAWYSYEARSWVGCTEAGIGYLTICPWCGGPLPRMEDAVWRALADPEE